MDDIYFWVLRVWRALTSSPNAIVAVIGVVAVVVTVTSVLAAPSDAREDAEPEVTSDVPEAVAVEEILPSGTEEGSVAGETTSYVFEPIEEISIGGVDDPGILPSSPFYFAKTFAREISLAFTTNPLEKANRKLRYANEDALAIRALCVEGLYTDAAKECFTYRDDFFASLAWAVKAKKEGADINAVMTNLQTAHHGHRVVFASALSHEEESHYQAVAGTVAYTSAPLEQVIMWLYGTEQANAFHTKLMSDYSKVDRDLWRVIEGMMGLEPEQAAALSEAMGDSSLMTGTPIITSIRADKSELEPGESCVLTCMASDLDGGALTYEWLSAEGSIESQESTATWESPEEGGLYQVKVVVTDDTGNQTSKSITLRVGEEEEEESGEPGGPFWIESFEVVPVGHSKLKQPVLGTEQWTIFQGRDAEITCVMDGDDSDLDYEWTCDVGTVSGSGAIINWEAPEHACYAEVSVVVSNGGSTSDSGEVVFRVSTCANCF
ncbi:PKD domain-containing protein [Chloroflexota bacterium]